MFRFVKFLTIVSLFVVSCTDKLQTDTIDLPVINPNQDKIDEQIILDYLADSNLIANRDTSGLYYIIEVEGEGEHPTYSSSIKVNYSGYLIDGTEFDSGSLDYYPLYNFIPGWQIGIPYLKPGGKAKLFLPSELAYGPYEYGNVPANSVLIFDVELIDFK